LELLQQYRREADIRQKEASRLVSRWLPCFRPMFVRAPTIATILPRLK
jgi:hypothetical protein